MIGNRAWHTRTVLMETIVESFRLLTDEQLLAEVRTQVRGEHVATAVLVASLAELELRKLHLAQGYSSLFDYCTRELRLSAKSAYLRIAAARCALRFPMVLDCLAEGSVTLTNLTLLRPHLTVDNHRQLLEAAAWKTKREVEQQVAAFCPEAEDLVPLFMRVRRETLDKLQRAQGLLRHLVPNGDPAAVFDLLLTRLLADHERKLSKVTRPRRARKAGLASRHVPAAVRRLVTARDGGRCAFVGTKGRCQETGSMEFHHVVPFAAGGQSTVDNIQLRCHAHNQYEADQEFPRETPAVPELIPKAAVGGGADYPTPS